MKPLPLLLLNALVTTGIVVAYDQIRGDPVQAPQARQTSAAGSSDLEARVAALEASERPMLQAAPRGDLDARLAALEARMDSDPSPVPADEPASEPLPVPQPRPGVTLESEEDMSPEAVAKFKKIINQVKRDERAKRIRKRTDKALARVGLELDESTRNKLARAYADFDRRRDEVWTEVKQGVAEGAGDADWAVIISDTQARLAGEFSERITDIVPATDADDVARALFPPSGSK